MISKETLGFTFSSPQFVVVDSFTINYRMKVTHVSTITEGTSSSIGISLGGSVSYDVNAKVSANIKDVFTAELGYSRLTDTNWAHTSSQTFQSSDSTQVRISVKPGNKQARVSSPQITMWVYAAALLIMVFRPT